MTLGPSPSLCCSFPSSLLLISSALSPKLLITSGFLTSEIGQRARTVHQAPSLPCDLGQVTFLLYISRGWVTFQALLATKQKLKAKIQDPSPLLQAFFIFTAQKGSRQQSGFGLLLFLCPALPGLVVCPCFSCCVCTILVSLLPHQFSQRIAMLGSGKIQGSLNGQEVGQASWHQGIYTGLIQNKKQGKTGSSPWRQQNLQGPSKSRNL